MDLDVAGDHRRIQLSELEEWWEKAYHNSKIHRQGARPTPLGARPPLLANQHESHGLCSTAFEDQRKPFNQGRFDPTAQIHLRGLYKQGPWPLEKSIPIIH